MQKRNRWRSDYGLWLETFVLVNFVFLTFDIFIAHSVNQFRHAAEYIPLFFSMVAPVILLIAIIAREREQSSAVWRHLGYLVGWFAVGVGLVGVILHLDSRFFSERTLKSLTYAAPFGAPLAYTGLGLLLIMNRMVDTTSREWAQWIVLLGLGGFFGNFVLSLTDHAANGFFRRVEWIPVIGSAFAVGFLLVVLLMPVRRAFLVVCALVLLGQVAVGLLGFFLHATANLKGPSTSIFQNFTNGAPPMAPLLFVNLVILAGIGLWVLNQRAEGEPKHQVKSVK